MSRRKGAALEVGSFPGTGSWHVVKKGISFFEIQTFFLFSGKNNGYSHISVSSFVYFQRSHGNCASDLSQPSRMQVFIRPSTPQSLCAIVSSFLRPTTSTHPFIRAGHPHRILKLACLACTNQRVSLFTGYHTVLRIPTTPKSSLSFRVSKDEEIYIVTHSSAARNQWYCKKTAITL